MRTPDGKRAVLALYDAEESLRVLADLQRVELSGAGSWHRGNLGAAVVDQLSSAAPIVAAGLQAGRLFQVVGTPELVEGLRAGTHVLMQTSQGSLGTVVSSSTHSIAGQLRFARASAAPILAPVLAWQLLHAIAGTSQLRAINKRLDALQRGLERLTARLEATALGEVRWAVEALDDILAERANTGTFTTAMDARLAHIEMVVGSILERNTALVELFRTKSKQAQQVGGKQGATKASSLLLEEGQQAVHDMQLLTGVVAADLRVEEALLYGAMERNPVDVQRRLDRINEKVERYRKTLENLPSVQGLERHAEECVQGMNWWQRKVFDRGVVKEVSRSRRIPIEDVRPSLVNTEEPVAESYVFWQDETGTKHARILPTE